MILLLTLLVLAVINGFIIIGFYEATQYKEENALIQNEWGKKITSKMALWFIAYYGNKILSDFWRKPFYACSVCMSSVHSSYVYWGFMYTIHNINITTAFIYPCYILLLAGVVTAMNKLF